MVVGEIVNTVRRHVVAVSVVVLAGAPASAPAQSAIRMGTHQGMYVARESASNLLCGATQSWVSLTVIRRVTLQPMTFTFPARIVVTKEARIRALDAALCGLPIMPRGTIACPSDNGVIYSLRFAGGSDTSSSVVVVDPGGCRTVTGVGPVRWAINRPSFWLAFGMAIGVRGASNATFYGTIGPSRN